MVHIKITKGLDIPIEGKPSGEIKTLESPDQVSLNLNVFVNTKFKLLAKPGEAVKIGQPLCDDKSSPGRYFVAPASGVIQDVRRGLKRRLIDIVIKRDEKEEFHKLNPVDINTASRQQIVDLLKEGGCFAHIRQRPFNLLADPTHTPRAIFVKAIESEPFACPAEMQVSGCEKEFQVGLSALAKLTDGNVNLVHRAGSSCEAFTKAKDVVIHTAEGPHPVGNLSTHIHFIDPVKSAEDVIWTVRVIDVITIGKMVSTGHYHTDRIISLAGTGIHEERRGFFKVRAGHPIGALVANRTTKGLLRLVSGDVLTGTKVDIDDYLGFKHTIFCVLKENTERELLHFFRLGGHKFTNSGTYLSGKLKGGARTWDFTTSTHGEERAFVDAAVYQDVMPMQIPVQHLVKAVISGDFESAEELGLFEVDAEDFALPTFVCPSKIEMTELMGKGIAQYAKEVLE
ncbi:MAG: NADH:ubiquinone reductase (Na(+)-transporting) subunit A [Waddliaceae bacterium]|nr:NADH:ubiquinone reductase (Na(+)-transporting) subunit A [Waddliaceae bacterium]